MRPSARRQASSDRPSHTQPVKIPARWIQVELTAGTFRVEVHDVVADDRHTAGLHLAIGEREGRTLEDREVLVFHIRDGKVIEVWQYLENQYTTTNSSPEVAAPKPLLDRLFRR
jgi:hypothetical protein